VRGIVIHALRTAFGDVIAHLQRVRAALGRDVEIIIDCTGQLPFAEMATRAGLSFQQLSIGGGGFDSVSFRGGREHVSKAALVAAVDGALSAGELIIPDDIPNAQVLVGQLGAFKMGRSPVTGQPVWADSVVRMMRSWR
jgi:hypothetical protein